MRDPAHCRIAKRRCRPRWSTNCRQSCSFLQRQARAERRARRRQRLVELQRAWRRLRRSSLRCRRRARVRDSSASSRPQSDRRLQGESRRRKDLCCRLVARWQRVHRRKYARPRKPPSSTLGERLRAPHRDTGRANQRDTVRYRQAPSTHSIRQRPQRGAEARLRQCLPWRTILAQRGPTSRLSGPTPETR